MKQLIRQLFPCLLLSLFTHVCVAQNELVDVRTALASYTNKMAPEKTFVHTDKEFYTAGEILWFKMYVVDGSTHQPKAASKIGYVEILDANNLPVSRAKVALNEKGGNGSVQLSLSLRSGVYFLRAYTQWMKNQGAEYFFQKKITIVNLLKSPEANEEKTSMAYSLQLFPEGGNLVAGLPSTIAFSIKDKNGKGAQGKGHLLNEQNDTLASFSPVRFGMGQFAFTPKMGNAYKVLFVTDDRSSVSQVLPKPYETGYVMHLEEASNERIKLTIKTNAGSGYPEIFLLAQTRQVVKDVQRNVISDGTAVFFIDKNKLDKGVSQLTVFNNEKKAVCERLYFIKPDVTTTTIKTSKPQYSLREQVKISLDTSLINHGSTSLSVYRFDELQADGESIQHSIWLTSELKGTVEQPGYYFSSGDDARQMADLLMLTQGWRRFKWENLSTKTPAIKFARENSGQFITGLVTDNRTGKAARNVQVFLSIPSTKYKLFTGISNAEGLVQFDVKDYFGQGEIIIQTNTEKDSFYKVEILSPFSEAYTQNTFEPLTLSSSSQNVLLNYSIGMQAQHLYNPDSLSQFFKNSVKDSFPFYGKPLYSYNLDEYVRFNTMEEVLREYVREINVGVKGSGSSLRFKLFNETDRELYTEDILVMADGIPFFNPGRAFSLNPLKIRKLDIINRNYVLGYATFRGLVNFTSYEENYSDLPLDPKAITIDYEGLQLQREFYSPDYSSVNQRNSRIPDFRSTLLWMANVKTQDVTFYTGDNKGQFIVVLQGIERNGKPITALSQIEVN